MVRSHYQTGVSRFKEFIGSLDKGDEDSSYDPIKKNKLDFFQHKPVQTPVDLKQKILKDDCRLFSKLFIARQSRECHLEFFHHDNQLSKVSACFNSGGQNCNHRY